MITLSLHRLSTQADGTMGELFHGKEFICYTGELPWKQNKRSISCIPDGEYRCVPHRSPKFGDVFLVEDVEGRDSILIHAGNFFGDTSEGYKSDTEGCILVGIDIGDLEADGEPQFALKKSRAALNVLRAYVASSPFLLEIIWDCKVEE